ncbi:hypothetical protein BaRGS_00035801 [Batillaria attramentaria]|uniref:Syntaxin-binding protein 5-like n=1 Tax=Batillaria attramentaria TaxID=370345 RepID=A0ABD0JDL9_9CAEN
MTLGRGMGSQGITWRYSRASSGASYITLTCQEAAQPGAIGRPGVDIHCTHDGDVAIFQVLFLINEGALVTVCSDDSLHLWNYRQKKPEIVHTLKFQRERITYCHLPFQSKWLYIGTERGNVHVVNIESFLLSGYVINWNKAIELCRKTHPGPVVHLSDNPIDSNKLLIGFEAGAIVMWDLRSKSAECRYNSPENFKAAHPTIQPTFASSFQQKAVWTMDLQGPRPAWAQVVDRLWTRSRVNPSPRSPNEPEVRNSLRRNETGAAQWPGRAAYDRGSSPASCEGMTLGVTEVLTVMAVPFLHFTGASSKAGEFFFAALRSIAWHHEGKQFMCSHSDGSLTTWNVKAPHKAVSVLMPHAKIGADGKPDPCKPIAKVEWKSVRNSDDMVMFSGGMSYDRAGRTPSITVMTGKSTTVLEMEHNVIDFVVLCETPWCHDFQDPYAIVVLLQNDLVVVDLTSPGYPCFENPYPMDIHESPVTACQYYANCPTDLIPAFYSVGSKQKKTGFSEKPWPIKGGQWGTTTVSYPEIMITGHADGSLKFWDASSVSLQILYKLKTAKMFEKPKRSGEGQDEDPFAIQMIYLCPESRLLCVAGATHVMLFRFSKQENNLEVSSLEFSIVYEIFDEFDSPEFEYPTLPRPSLAVTTQHSSSMGSYSSNTSDNNKTEQMTAVKVRPGARKWAAGYQADLVCVLCYVEGEPPGNITVMSLNSSYGLLAFGNESGLAIVDFIQKTCLLNLGTPDLYGSMDPYQRAPRSPRSKKTPTEGVNQGSEEGKSPTTDQASSSNDRVPPTAPASLGGEAVDSSVFTFVTDFSHVQSPMQEDSDSSNPPTQLQGVPEEGGETAGADQPPSPLKLMLDNSAEVTEKSLSTGNVSEEGLTSKPTACKTLSDSSVLDREDDEHQVPKLRRSLSDPDLKKRGGVEQRQRKTSVLARVRGKSHAKHSNESAGAKEHLTKQQLEEPQKEKKSPLPSPVEVAEEAVVLDGSASSALNEQNVSGDSESKGSESHQSKSFLRRVSVKIKSSFGGKEKKDVESEDSSEARAAKEKELEAKAAKERAKSMKEKKLEVIDLSGETQKKPTVRRMSVVEMCQGKRNGYCLFLVVLVITMVGCTLCTVAYTMAKTFGVFVSVPVVSFENKNDGSSFSRSRSSSISSLDNVTKEAIQCLVFADSYTRKTDSLTCPCLWVGTSLGSVIVINLNLPADGEQRAEQPTIVSPSGTIFRLKGSIVGMSFLDCNGILIQQLSLKASRQMSVSTKPKISPTSSTELTDRQFVIICSEKQARVMSLPSQACAYKVKITETSFVVKAEIVTVRDSVCLMCYIANGHIMAFSLPSLKPLYDEDFLPLTDYRVARTFCFSNSGHALFLCSPTEVQKITYSADIAENLSEMLGDLFLPCETPEAPKQGFFKNLFGGGTANLDREELFGEASGKASKGLAKHIPGTGGLQQLQQQSGAVGGEFARTRLLVAERGEKLGELDDRSAQMMNQAETFSQAAHHIMLKYKDKKWYQF